MRPFIIWLLLMTGLLLVSQQAKGNPVVRDSSEAESIIMSFLREVYGTQDDASTIAQRYITFEDSPASPSEFSRAKRYEIAAEHIMLLRKGEAIGFASAPLNKWEIAALQIVPYTSLVSTGNNKLLHFELNDRQSQYLYVALKNNVAWKYFLVKKGKIYSFDYLLKGEGGPAYLFGY